MSFPTPIEIVPAAAPREAASDRLLIDMQATMSLAKIRSKKTLKKYWQQGCFPAPVRKGPHANGQLFWFEDEVLAHLDLARRPPVLPVAIDDPDMDEQGNLLLPGPTPDDAAGPDRVKGAAREPGRGRAGATGSSIDQVIAP